MNGRRIFVVAQKEWREILRDRIYFSLAFLLPLVLMMVFGYGMAQEVDNISVAIVDHDRSALSRDYGHRFSESRHFDYKGHLRHQREAEALMEGGELRVAILIPPGFQRRLLSGQRAEVQTLVDGVVTMRLRTINGYIESINAAANAELQATHLIRTLGISKQRAQTLLSPVTLEVRYLYNQELREAWSMAPALVMFILMVCAPTLMAQSVVREKESGTIYNIYASTITRGEFLLGKLIPNIGVSFVNGLILLVLATLYFGAPFKGDLSAFLTAMLVYVFCVCCIGLLVSLLVRTQVAAILITVISGFILAMQFSGMMTPLNSMSEVNYAISHAVPPRYFNKIVTITFLKGGGWAEAWRPFAALVAFAVGLFTLAHLLFRKRSRT